MTLDALQEIFETMARGLREADSVPSGLAFWEESEYRTIAGSYRDDTPRNVTVEVTHNLGVVPLIGGIELRCKVADHGYEVGDKIRLPLYSDGNDDLMLLILNGTTTTATIVFFHKDGESAGTRMFQVALPRKNMTSIFHPRATKWEYRFYLGG